MATHHLPTLSRLAIDAPKRAKPTDLGDESGESGGVQAQTSIVSMKQVAGFGDLPVELQRAIVRRLTPMPLSSIIVPYVTFTMAIRNQTASGIFRWHVWLPKTWEQKDIQDYGGEELEGEFDALFSKWLVYDWDIDNDCFVATADTGFPPGAKKSHHHEFYISVKEVRNGVSVATGDSHILRQHDQPKNLDTWEAMYPYWNNLVDILTTVSGLNIYDTERFDVDLMRKCFRKDIPVHGQQIANIAINVTEVGEEEDM